MSVWFQSIWFVRIKSKYICLPCWGGCDGACVGAVWSGAWVINGGGHTLSLFDENSPAVITGGFLLSLIGGSSQQTPNAWRPSSVKNVQL